MQIYIKFNLPNLGTWPFDYKSEVPGSPKITMFYGVSVATT